MTETIQKLTYDDFGNIVHIDRGGTAADMSYEYDLLHGWVKSVQSAGGFNQTLKREAGGLYNGSIASMSWMMPNDMVERTYNYTYDGLNRLTNSEYGESAYATSSDDVVWPGDDESIPALGVSALHQLIPQSMLSLNDEAGISIQSAGGYRGNPFDDDDEMIVEEEPLFENKYGESVTYDKNSNITTLKRCGMLNNRTYGLIDDLTIEYNGNQRKKVTDAVTEHLTYDGASDFEDNSSASTQYLYHPNGTIKRDLNRRLVNNILDDQGHTKALNFSGNKYIYYVYAADGTKLRVSHESPVFATGSNVVLYWLRDTTEYCGNLTLKNGHLHTYQFPGGYASFDGDTLSGWHYYVQDYMGNNRMVVNKDNTIEQTTHYYPYGGVIGDLSTNENLQAYKFEGKALAAIEKVDNLRREREALAEGQDRNFGLDWYDIHARQYDAIGVPTWNAIDPLAEKRPDISPYVYCAGDPVNLVDLDGKDVWTIDEKGNVQRDKWDGMDVIRIVDSNGDIVSRNYYEIGTVSGTETKNGYVFSFGDDSAASKEAFETLSDNTEVEWSNVECASTKDEAMSQNYVSTSRSSHNERNGINVVDWSNNYAKKIHHSHPSGKPDPSGMFDGINGDIGSATMVMEKSPESSNCSFAVYVPNGNRLHGYYYYTPMTTPESFLSKYGIKVTK